MSGPSVTSGGVNECLSGSGQLFLCPWLLDDVLLTKKKGIILLMVGDAYAYLTTGEDVVHAYNSKVLASNVGSTHGEVVHNIILSYSSFEHYLFLHQSYASVIFESTTYII